MEDEMLELKIVVIGLGKMGTHYLEKLENLGFTKNSIIGVETDPINLLKAIEKHPDMFITDNILEAFDHNPDVAIVAVNSVAHLGVIELCYSAGIRKIFCEKPLVYYNQEITFLEKFDNSELYVAHLINFSGVVKVLMDFIIENDLIVAQASSIWGKNWPGEKRIIGGDAEEETPHPLALIMAVINCNQQIQKIDVFSRTSSIPHVQPQYLKHAKSLELGFPDKMNDSTIADFSFFTDTGIVQAMVHTSFNFFDQRKVVEFGFWKREQTDVPPVYKAQLSFDVDRRDRVVIMEAETGDIPLLTYTSGDKITSNLEAALRAFSGEKPDQRLTTFDHAAELVKIIQKIVNQ